MQTKEKGRIGFYGEMISLLFNHTFQSEYDLIRDWKKANGEYAYPEFNEQPERKIIIDLQPKSEVHTSFLRNGSNGSFTMFDDKLCQELYDEGSTYLWQDGKWIEGGIITFDPKLKGVKWSNTIYHELCHAFFHLAGNTIYSEPITYTFSEWIDMGEWDFVLKELCLIFARINLELESGKGLTEEHEEEITEVITKIPMKICDKIKKRLDDIDDS